MGRGLEVVGRSRCGVVALWGGSRLSLRPVAGAGSRGWGRFAAGEDLAGGGDGTRRLGGGCALGAGVRFGRGRLFCRLLPGRLGGVLAGCLRREVDRGAGALVGEASGEGQEVRTGRGDGRLGRSGRAGRVAREAGLYVLFRQCLAAGEEGGRGGVAAQGAQGREVLGGRGCPAASASSRRVR